MASMAGAPRVRSLNIAAPEAEARPVLVPGGNKARLGPANARKPSLKPVRKAETGTPEKAVAAGARKEEGAKKNAAGEGGGGAAKGASPLPSPRRTPPGKAVAAGAKREEGAKRNAVGEGGGAGPAKGASPLPSPRRTPPGPPPRKSDASPQPSLPLNASCSSDASAESTRVRASAGRVERGRSCRPTALKHGKAAVKAAGAEVVAPATPVNAELEGKRRCAWVTPTTDSCYVAFHDGEWGVPVHDDREIFMDFDPAVVSKINEKKLVAPGSIASSLLSEQKLRAVLENACQILKIVDEFGSFHQYCWGFLNNKPIVNQFRHTKQVPVKSPKADIISKDMLKRGFRGVGPTVIYSFMQAAGLTNDHLVSCFRFKECNANTSHCASDPKRVDMEADLKKDEMTTKICCEEIITNADMPMMMDALTVS
ncbi:hypothetical protein PR202_ga14802 [Eleusine coracana subsp. coracana]|uniref:DNA-3-methyladenine glycosylase I n=1 Tax=Eleusine coracana subsp. coracana TaxID=191504 RepID=A0AAV5CIH4_ELECO|nr:hypothetical protein PR202_ga14802 [Eleusine coracana subsp. coracana]